MIFFLLFLIFFFSSSSFFFLIPSSLSLNFIFLYFIHVFVPLMLRSFSFRLVITADFLLIAITMIHIIDVVPHWRSISSRMTCLFSFSFKTEFGAPIRGKKVMHIYMIKNSIYGYFLSNGAFCSASELCQHFLKSSILYLITL